LKKWAIAGVALIVVIIVVAASFLSMGSNEEKTDPPGAPTDLVLQRGEGEVYLTWEAPSSNGTSPIEHYTVYIFSSNDASSYDGKHETEEDHFTWTGLEGETTYYFAVSASNEDKEGDMTDIEHVTTLAVVVVPNASDLVLGPEDLGADYSIDSTTTTKPTDLVSLGLRSYILREFARDTADPMNDWQYVSIEICVCATDGEADSLLTKMFQDYALSPDASDYVSKSLGNESLYYKEYQTPGILIDAWLRSGSIVLHMELDSSLTDTYNTGKWFDALMTSQMDDLAIVNVGVF